MTKQSGQQLTEPENISVAEGGVGAFRELLGEHIATQAVLEELPIRGVTVPTEQHVVIRVVESVMLRFDGEDRHAVIFPLPLVANGFVNPVGRPTWVHAATCLG